MDLERNKRAAAENAVHLMIEQHIPALKRFAHRLVGSRGDVDDLVQETLAKALGAAKQFTPGTAMKSWLFTIMRNTFCSAYRGRRREHVGIEDAMLASLSVPPAQDWAVRQSEMTVALQRLPPQIRQSLVLVAMGSSYDETAQICHCEVGTVKSRVNRGRKALTDELGTLSYH